MTKEWREAITRYINEYVFLRSSEIEMVCLKKEEGNSSCGDDTISFYGGLLLEQDRTLSSKYDSICSETKYPKYPLIDVLAKEIINWVEDESCPFIKRISMPLLNEEISRENREKLCAQCEPVIKDLGSTFRNVRLLCDEEAREEFEEVMMKSFYTKTKTKNTLFGLLDTLRERGILHLLGLRETTGSIIALPPPFAKLMKSFTDLHNEKSKLTVGARAMSKHFHRCKSEWWGNCKGKEEEKNEHALKVLERIVSDCVWINIHVLPHEVYVIELRCSKGYGARWTSDGEKFRGFLEPQMEDGHSIGWKH